MFLVSVRQLCKLLHRETCTSLIVIHVHVSVHQPSMQTLATLRIKKKALFIATNKLVQLRIWKSLQVLIEVMLISVLGALNLIKTEYCTKWKMLHHWKLAKDLCVCVRERKRKREREREVKIQRERGGVSSLFQCVHTCIRSQPPHQPYQPTTFPLSSPLYLYSQPWPGQRKPSSASHTCKPHYLIPSYLDIKGSSLLQ